MKDSNKRDDELRETRSNRNDCCTNEKVRQARSFRKCGSTVNEAVRTENEGEKSNEEQNKSKHRKRGYK